MADPVYSKEQAIAEFEAYISPQKVAAYRALGIDFVPGRREGSRIWDIDGSRSLINLRASGGVFNLGHRPPITVDALKRALDALDIGDHILMSAPRARLARRLADNVTAPERRRRPAKGAYGEDYLAARGYEAEPEG